MKNVILIGLFWLVLVSTSWSDESSKKPNKNPPEELDLQKSKSNEIKVKNKIDKNNEILDERYIQRKEKAFLLLDYSGLGDLVYQDNSKHVSCKFKGGRLIDFIKNLTLKNTEFWGIIPGVEGDINRAAESGFIEWFPSKEDRKKFVEKNKITFNSKERRIEYLEGDLTVKNLIIHKDLWDYPVPEIEFNEVTLITLLEYVFETSYSLIPEDNKYKDFRILIKLRNNFTNLTYDLANKKENSDSPINLDGRKIIVQSLNIFTHENKHEQVTDLLSVLESFAKESGDKNFNMKYHEKTSMLYVNCDIRCEEMINSTINQILKIAEEKMKNEAIDALNREKEAERQLKLQENGKKK